MSAPRSRSYINVAAAQTDAPLSTDAGLDGGINDLIERLIITNTSATAAAVSIKDGASGAAISIAPATLPIGVHVVELNILSVDGGWFITTGADVKVLAVGKFSSQ